MSILVINSGSSSMKFAVYTAAGGQAEPAAAVTGEIGGIGGHAELSVARPGAGRQTRPARADDTAAAFDEVLEALRTMGMPAIAAVGYRVVHPGARLEGHQRITDAVIAELEAAAAFAPLHDPAVVEVIRAGRRRFPDAPHFACFDTVFHETMPEEAKTYPLPLTLRAEGVHRYGFHGLSCESVVWRLKQSGPIPRRMVIAHLGSGCSVTALAEGRSVDNSMGLTPDGGIVMGTRPGDLDPGLIFYLLRQQGGAEDAATRTVEDMLNHHAGMVGMTGLENDLKAIRKAADEGNADAVLALKVFTRSVRRAIGGCTWLLGGLDTLVFTGGIGEHDAATRAEVLDGLQGWGIVLDEVQNYAQGQGRRAVSRDGAALAVLVVPAEEELTIARHVIAMMAAE